MEEKKKGEITVENKIALVKQFRNKEDYKSQDIFNFCKKMEIPLVDKGFVQDIIYQQEYDEKMSLVIPLVLQELGTITYTHEFSTEEKRKEDIEKNQKISENIAKIIEENGVAYVEKDFLKSVADHLMKILEASDNRLSNMSMTVLMELAQEKLGSPLTIKALKEEWEQIAKRKAEKQGNVGRGVSKLLNEFDKGEETK